MSTEKQNSKAKARPKEEPLFGTVIGGSYRITGKLGEGGMGGGVQGAPGVAGS